YSDDVLHWVREASVRYSADHRGDQDRADDTPEAPRDDHEAVDGSGVSDTEEIPGGRGHGTETTAIAEVNDGGEHEPQNRVRCVRNHQQTHTLQPQHRGESGHPAHVVRGGGPDNAPATVEHGQYTDHGGGSGRTVVGDVLGAGSSDRDQRDPDSDIESEDRSEQIPLH